MIFRRFVTALRQQDWATVAIEFLIVVAGIFVGLQVDEWRDDIANKTAEYDVLANLHTDIVELQEMTTGDLSQRMVWMADFAEMRRAVFGLPPNRAPSASECMTLGAAHIERWPPG